MLPKDMEKREFAFQPFDSHSYIRHLSFKDEASLRRYMSDNPPLHAYYSSASFLFPEIPDMEQKGWLGSDLIFDIDADELKGCGEKETLYVCSKCGYNFRGLNIKDCPKCGSKEIVEVETTSENCIRMAGETARKLVETLENELGIKTERILFSGNRGFHVHTQCDDECKKLTSEERREIVDYLKGTSIDVHRIILMSSSKRFDEKTILPRPTDPGWRGRIAREIYKDLGFRKEMIIPYSKIKHLIDLPATIYEYVEKASIIVDEKVTIDLHRLVRIPGSLNGKTGLVAKPVFLDELKDFAINCSLSPFKGDMTIVLRQEIKKANILGDTISGGRGERLGVDKCIGIYLLLKGLAYLQ